jgi:Dockerin type I domain
MPGGAGRRSLIQETSDVRVALLIACLVGAVGHFLADAEHAQADTVGAYPIQAQPGIWPPEAPHVTYYTPPPGYPMATEYLYAVQDIYNPAPADVEIDWLEVHAIVNGQDIVIDRSDYGSGAGQQRNISGDYTLRSDMVTELPGSIFSSWTTDAVSLTPSDNPGAAYSVWNDTPGLVPAGATDVYVQARLLVTGSAVAQIGLDYWNTSLTANVNGAYGGFRIFASPDWQTVTLGFRPAVEGDVNNDNQVNGLDVNMIASHWMQLGTSPPGDANGDGVVNGLDLNLVASHWLQSGSVTQVPEPASMLLAVFGDVILLGCCRRVLSGVVDGRHI